MASNQQERYTLGYTSTPTATFHASRTATSDAAFLLPYLKPGISLLDCGCGPGSITIGLAEVVAPGEVEGIDVGPEYIELARSAAEKQGVANVSFREGSIYELPVPDESFDAVFAHAVLNHLGDPLKALFEMRRVLKPGGVVGVRVTDHAENVCQPTHPMMERWLDLFIRLYRHNGGDHLIARRLGALLSEAGFTRINLSASYQSFGNPEAVRALAEREAGTITQPPVSEQLIELGWASHADLEEIAGFWRSWGENPDAFFARSHREAVGWKE